MPILVNGEVLPEQLIHAEFERLLSHPDFLDINELEKRRHVRQAAETGAVNRLLLTQEALKDRRPLDEAAVQAAIAEFRTQNGEHAAVDERVLRATVEARLLVHRKIDEIKREARQPSLRATKKMFNENRDSFHAPPCIRASQIVKHKTETVPPEQARAAVEVALAELEAGAAFADVAARHSDCPAAGGDLGYFPREHMVDEFDQAVFPLEIGERTGVFETWLGFHIVKLTERRPASARPFKEARERIEKTLRAAAEFEAMRAATERFRANADIRRVTLSKTQEPLSREASERSTGADAPA
jgi:parvulin-like peptidyl-prolyl isomerase